MANLILTQVVEQLTGAGIPAALAYPGSPMPHIAAPVAAVHMQQVDSGSRTSTVEVHILCPGDNGGAACEEAALTAYNALCALGAVCRQEGCAYDRVTGLYSARVTAAFTQVVQDETVPVVLPGFSVELDGVAQTLAVAFTAQRTTGAQPDYATGESDPVGSHLGKGGWSLTLEEQIPPGTQEPADVTGVFSLTVNDGVDSWVYTGCRWTAIRREYTSQGLRRVRTGFALSRKEA